MKNQYYTGTPTQARQVTMPAGAGIKAGDPLLVGKEPCVALDDYQSNIGGATCYFGGSYALAVIGQSAESPSVGAAIKPGDKIYATGTLDATTNVTYGLTLDVNTGNTLFGYLDPVYTAGVTSGATNTSAVVRLQGAE